MTYVEDYLQHYVEKVGVSDSNKQILESINRQIKKGVALTDRQHELVVKMLVDKFENFTGNEPLRKPLRHVDREKYIEIVSTLDVFGKSNPYELYKNTWQWIKIRFPFSKKTIVSVESVANKHRKYYHHAKGSHEHFFKLNERTVRDVCNEFAKKDFKISSELLDLYCSIKNIEQSPDNYVTGYWNNQIHNLSIDVSNLTPYQIADKKRQLGLHRVECELPSGILETVCSRKESYVLLKPSMFSFSEVAESIITLDRFPLLVLISNEKELDQISSIHRAFEHVIPNEQQCCLFRIENKNNIYNVNDFIHEKSLNNWLDHNTKIVYIKGDKLPKLLIKEQWVPQCVLSLDSMRKNSHVATYCRDVCDLIIDFDEEPSIWRGGAFGNV